MSKKSSSTNPYGTSAAREPEPTVEIDPNNVIVRFEDGIPSDERDRLRKEAKVTQFKTCPCGDKNLELWGVDTSVINAFALSSAKCPMLSILLPAPCVPGTRLRRA